MLAQGTHKQTELSPMKLVKQTLYLLFSSTLANQWSRSTRKCWFQARPMPSTAKNRSRNRIISLQSTAQTSQNCRARITSTSISAGSWTSIPALPAGPSDGASRKRRTSLHRCAGAKISDARLLGKARNWASFRRRNQRIRENCQTIFRGRGNNNRRNNRCWKLK